MLMFPSFTLKRGQLEKLYGINLWISISYVIGMCGGHASKFPENIAVSKKWLQYERITEKSQDSR